MTIGSIWYGHGHNMNSHNMIDDLRKSFQAFITLSSFHHKFNGLNVSIACKHTRTTYVQYLYRYHLDNNEVCMFFFLLFLPRDKHIQWWNTQSVGNDQYIIVFRVL